MSDDIGLSAALGSLPLFPLPQVALFPGATLPLHVFEPRYRALVEDVLASHRTLAVVQIVDPDVVDEHGHPAIARIAGIGTIVDDMQVPGGRYNILIKGQAVVRLEELPFVPPYRRARAEIVADTSGSEVPAAELTALLSTAAAFARVVREKERSFELRLPKDTTAGTLANLCAAQLLLGGGDRQRVLEERSPRRRVQLVTECLVLQNTALATPGKTLN